MNQYITFHKILDYIETWQQNSPIMNSFGYGNLIDFGRTISGDTQNNTVQYPFIFVVPQGISYDVGTTTYQLSIIFADILNTDYSNEKDCVSDMSLQSKRFISSILNGLNGENPYMYENMDIEMPVQAIPFFERFGDHVAGVALNTNIIVFEDINDCNYYVEPTPTPSASPTTTPTSTPTNTPTITPTNTTTPSPTPTTPPICGEQITISNANNPEFDGTYNRVYSWTGGTFVGGWYSAGSPLGDGLWHSGVNPSGSLYSTYVRNVGTTAYTITDFYVPSTSTDRYFSLFKSEGSLIDNQIITYYSGLIGFTGSTNIGGVLYLTPGQNNSIFGNSMYVSYPSICPTTTPTNTLTPTPPTTTTSTPTTTPTTTPTNTPTGTPPSTPPPTPTPCPNVSYLCQNSSNSGSLVIQWTDYASGNLTTATIGPLNQRIVCSKTVPIRISGVNSLTVSIYAATCGC